MLVLPIVNRNRIMNVEIRLKTAKKVKKQVKYEDIDSSDIIIRNINFINSVYNIEKPKLEDITEFIRNNNQLTKSDFFISTKESSDTGYYDIYQVANPPVQVSIGLDRLYASAVLDMKNEIPNNEKGKYVDFSKIGVADNITEERLAKLKEVATTTNKNYKKTLIENDLYDLVQTLDFLKLFECNVIETSSMKLEDFLRVLNTMNTTKTRDSKLLNNYYKMALSNKSIYSLISKLYNIVYNDSLNWIHGSKDKVKIKNNNEGKAA